MNAFVRVVVPRVLVTAAFVTGSFALANAPKPGPSPSASPGPSVAAVELGELAKALTPELCKNGFRDPIETLRLEIARFRQAYPSKPALQARLKELLAREIRDGRDAPELNWIRAVNPWLLPPDFPARPALTKCAAELKNFSDTRLDVAVDEWKDCLEIAFPKEKPAEFEAIRKCLGATAHLRPESR